MIFFQELMCYKKSLVVAFGLCIVILLSSCAAYNDLVLDNEEHGLPCTKLPSTEQVQRIVASHQDVIQEIENVNLGQIFVDIDTETCPASADIIIFYGSHQDRLAIKKIIGSDTFFGIPYRLHNN